MKRRRLLRPVGVLAAAAGLVVGLAACGSGGTSSASSTSTSTAQLTPVIVTIPAEAIAFTPLYIGVYGGYYKDVGLDVTIQVIPVTLEPQALVTGKVTFVGSLGYLINAIAGHPTEFPVKVLAACGDNAPFLLVGGTGITKLTQLKGGVIAGDAPNSQPDLFAQAVLAKHGIQTNEYSIDEVGAQAAGRWALVQAGKAQAAMVDSNDPVLPPVKGHTVLATGKTYPSIGCGVATTTSYISSHKKIVKDFVAATAKAAHAAVTDEAVAVAAMKKGLASLNFGYTKAQWDQAWQLSKFIWTSTGLPSKASEQAALTTAQSRDKLTAPPPATLVFDFQYVPKKL